MAVSLLVSTACYAACHSNYCYSDAPFVMRKSFHVVATLDTYDNLDVVTMTVETKHCI